MEKMSLEEEYFGEKVGWMSLYETPWPEFNQKCALSKSIEGDCTGHRLYAGAHVATRFILSFCDLVQNASVIELGCGTGIFGIFALKFGRPKKVVLTDGMESTLEIAKRNISHLLTIPNYDQNVLKLEWDVKDDIIRAKELLNDGQPFDIVLGCELMYYRTDVGQLCRTVLSLCGNNGLFLHCHLFRRPGQEEELIKFLDQHNWTTLEVPCESFISADELNCHADWYNMRILVSGPREKLETIHITYSSWIPFVAEPEAPTDSELLGPLFSR